MCMAAWSLVDGIECLDSVPRMMVKGARYLAGVGSSSESQSVVMSVWQRAFRVVQRHGKTGQALVSR